MDKRTFQKHDPRRPWRIKLPDALAKLVEDNSHRLPDELAKDEDFWAGVRNGYRLKPDYINLKYYCFPRRKHWRISSTTCGKSITRVRTTCARCSGTIKEK